MTSSDFAVRFGYQKPAMDLNDEAMPTSLRNGLWDVAVTYFFMNIAKPGMYGSSHREDFLNLCNSIWFNFFKQPMDEISSNPFEALSYVREKFFSFPFYDVYRFLEFLSKQPARSSLGGNATFTRSCNRVFERERAAFRFVSNTLVKISEAEHVGEIESSIEQSDSMGVSAHIRRSCELYSMNEPDYRNSVKESISAVEAAVRFVTGRKTSGVARPLRAISDTFSLHPALRDGFEKLYAFTSDESGVRHALLEETKITQADARYMLVSCSAFANYLLALQADLPAK